MNVSEAIAQILKKENIDWISCFPNNPLIEDLNLVQEQAIRSEESIILSPSSCSPLQ